MMGRYKRGLLCFVSGMLTACGIILAYSTATEEFILSYFVIGILFFIVGIIGFIKGKEI